MSALTIVFTVLQVLSGLAVTAIVLMQSGKSAGLSGAISGGAETFLSKGKAKTLDAKLARMTKWFALALSERAKRKRKTAAEFSAAVFRSVINNIRKSANCGLPDIFIPMFSRHPGSSPRWPASRF